MVPGGRPARQQGSRVGTLASKGRIIRLGPPPGGPVHFLLFYEFVPDYLQRRAPQRAEHLRLAWAAHERGELILGGALAEPADGAVVLFQGPDERTARAFAEADPYVTTGLVRRWWVRPWTTVVGDAASTPVRNVGS
jgi:uncharacterized protein